MTYKKQDVNLP